MGSSIFQLEPFTRMAYRRAIAQLNLEGIEVITTSTRRTNSEQRVLYERHLRGENPFPVNPPGTSTHEKGIAVDLVPKNPQHLPRVVRVLEIFNFKWAGPGDRVHFTYQGSARALLLASQCQQMTLPLPAGFELC